MKRKTLIQFLICALSIFICDHVIAQWAMMESVPTPRTNATASTLNGKIYLIGGVEQLYGSALQTVEAYDPMTNTWDTRIADYPIPVTDASSQVVNGILYVFGGRAGYYPKADIYQSVYAYNETKNTWIPKADLPNSSYHHKTVVVMDTVYIIGGAANDLASQMVYAYLPDKDKFIRKEDLPMPRALHGVQAVGRHIYSFGGAYLGIIRNSVYRYSIDHQKWEEVVDLREPIMYHGSGKLDNEIYVFGGLKSWAGGKSTQSTWKLQIEEDTMYWVDVQADMPVEVIGYAYSMAIDEKGRLAYYMFSGATKSFYNLDGGEALSTSTIKFTPEKLSEWKYMAPMPTPRALTTSVELDGKIYVIGGVFRRNGPATDIVEAYDIETDTWETIAPLPIPLCNATASATTLATTNKKIYVMGGSDYHLGPGKKNVFTYDPVTGQWDEIAELPKPVMCASSAIPFGHWVYVAGGVGTNYMASALAFSYHPGQKRWYEMPRLNSPRAFMSLDAPAIETRPAYAIGGLYLGEPVSSIEILNTGLDPYWQNIDVSSSRWWHGSGIVGNFIYVYGGYGARDALGRYTPMYDIMRFDMEEERWESFGDPIPEFTSPFASAIIEETNARKNLRYISLYAIGGPTPDFWNNGNGPFVTGMNLMLRKSELTTSINEISEDVSVILHPNIPNPFSVETQLTFEIDQPGVVTLDVINMNGQKVVTIFNGFKSSGKHTISYIPENLPDGVYFYQLKTQHRTAVRKMILQSGN